MNLTELFVKVTRMLNDCKIDYALAGGLLASVYRNQPRATQDLDLFVLVELEDADSIIQSLGFQTQHLRRAQLEGGPMFAIKRKSTPVCVVAGRTQSHGIGIDFILPSMPWPKECIDRSKKNLIDFGFGKIPCLTPEDLILTKIYAINNQSTRFMDLDDLKSIFEAELELDLPYLAGQMQVLGLQAPAALKGILPPVFFRRRGKTSS